MTARRCTACGAYEHRTQQLPAACLISDLTRHYVEGEHRGPGLLIQLQAALGDPRRKDPGASTGHTKPGSKPPGWRSDISDLLTDIQAVTNRKLTPAQRRLADQHSQTCRTQLDDLGYPSHLRYAPTRLTCTRWHHLARRIQLLEHTPNALEDLQQWKLQARQRLGLVVPSVALTDVICARRILDVGGWTWIGCQQTTLRVAQDGQSDVWCSNPQCHDDHRHPDCRVQLDTLGYDADLDYAPPSEQSRINCRRTERDLRHAIRWNREQWAAMWAEQTVAS